MMLPILAAAALACTATDGDTLRCGAERIRLIGIDAPEMHGCPRWRECAPGSGPQSKASLARLMRGHRVQIERFGKDRYGRTLAIAHAGGVNLACAQLRAGQAIYIARWDVKGRIARACR